MVILTGNVSPLTRLPGAVENKCALHKLNTSEHGEW